MRIIDRQEIDAILPDIDLIPLIEAGFVGYSTGWAVVPPVGELLLDGGDVHIKYGYLRQDDYYIVKIASGFYENPSLGLPTSNGLMLLFEQRTGELAAILLDEGRLTDIRTAVAGAISAKYLAPTPVERIGILGTGIQARLQVEYLASVTPCRAILAWGRSAAKLDEYRADMESKGFEVEITNDASELFKRCNLVVTCTPATQPLLDSRELRPGTHITAVGSDTPNKQELEASVLSRADVVVADSIAQCRVRGEIGQAIKAGSIQEEDIIELGALIYGEAQGRRNQSQITVADLTGVAVQDIQIAKAIFKASEERSGVP